MSNERLRVRLITAGFEEEVVMEMAREDLLARYAEVMVRRNWRSSGKNGRHNKRIRNVRRNLNDRNGKLRKNLQDRRLVLKEKKGDVWKTWKDRS